MENYITNKYYNTNETRSSPLICPCFIMLVSALVAFFKYKVVSSICVVACWSPVEQLKFIRLMSDHGMSATFCCYLPNIGDMPRRGLKGLVYFQSDDTLLEKLTYEQFSNSFVWLMVENELPATLNQIRYDCDIAFMRSDFKGNFNVHAISQHMDTIFFEDVYVHPSEGVSLHPWAHWNQRGLVVTHNIDKIRRRLNFKGYPLRIAAPIGHYSPDWYNGSYTEYIADETLTEMDGGIRCGTGASELLIAALNATKEIQPVKLWGATISNDSMVLHLKYGEAELSGGILRIMIDRITKLDYIMPIWPFNVGFSLLAERASSSNMFVEPFSAGVWWSYLVIGLILAVAQTITARTQEEKDDARYAVLATLLQQDASAVPKGISGRWTFTVVSVCSMLVHAYYTSAIVSALMSTGMSGPDSLTSLADSRYAIASEDYDYMRYLMFDMETNWDELEYLKKKKKTPEKIFYQELERGVELVKEGNTAFHSEYNQIYPHFKTFTDEQICKLQHVDTIPETMTWITTKFRSEYINVFRSASTWILEVGIGRRLVSRLLALRPPCRAQLLAERVKFGDVAPLLACFALGLFLSLIILLLEIVIAKFWNRFSYV